MSDLTPVEPTPRLILCGTPGGGHDSQDTGINHLHGKGEPMRHEPRNVSRGDLVPGDVVAVRHPHGTWSIRRAGAEYIMEDAEYVLLERDIPDCPAVIIDEGHLDSDPDVDRPSADLYDALAVRVSTPTCADGYLVVSNMPFIASAADIATTRWRRAVVLDSQEIQDIAATYSCADLAEVLKTAWGESDD